MPQNHNEIINRYIKKYTQLSKSSECQQFYRTYKKEVIIDETEKAAQHQDTKQAQSKKGSEPGENNGTHPKGGQQKRDNHDEGGEATEERKTEKQHPKDSDYKDHVRDNQSDKEGEGRGLPPGNKNVKPGNEESKHPSYQEPRENNKTEKPTRKPHPRHGPRDKVKSDREEQPPDDIQGNPEGSPPRNKNTKGEIENVLQETVKKETLSENNQIQNKYISKENDEYKLADEDRLDTEEDASFEQEKRDIANIMIKDDEEKYHKKRSFLRTMTFIDYETNIEYQKQFYRYFHFAVRTRTFFRFIKYIYRKRNMPRNHNKLVNKYVKKYAKLHKRTQCQYLYDEYDEEVKVTETQNSTDDYNKENDNEQTPRNKKKEATKKQADKKEQQNQTYSNNNRKRSNKKKQDKISEENRTEEIPAKEEKHQRKKGKTRTNNENYVGKREKGGKNPHNKPQQENEKTGKTIYRHGPKYKGKLDREQNNPEAEKLKDDNRERENKHKLNNTHNRKDNPDETHNRHNRKESPDESDSNGDIKADEEARQPQERNSDERSHAHEENQVKFAEEKEEIKSVTIRDTEETYMEKHNFLRKLTFTKSQKKSFVFYRYFRFNLKTKALFRFIQFCYSFKKMPQNHNKIINRYMKKYTQLSKSSECQQFYSTYKKEVIIDETEKAAQHQDTKQAQNKKGSEPDENTGTHPKGGHQKRDNHDEGGEAIDERKTEKQHPKDSDYKEHVRDNQSDKEGEGRGLPPGNKNVKPGNDESKHPSYQEPREYKKIKMPTRKPHPKHGPRDKVKGDREEQPPDNVRDYQSDKYGEDEEPQTEYPNNQQYIYGNTDWNYMSYDMCRKNKKVNEDQSVSKYSILDIYSQNNYMPYDFYPSNMQDDKKFNNLQDDSSSYSINQYHDWPYTSSEYDIQSYSDYYYTRSENQDYDNSYSSVGYVTQDDYRNFGSGNFDFFGGNDQYYIEYNPDVQQITIENRDQVYQTDSSDSYENWDYTADTDQSEQSQDQTYAYRK